MGIRVWGRSAVRMSAAVCWLWGMLLSFRPPTPADLIMESLFVFFYRKFRLKKISSFERQSAVYTLHMLKQLVQLQRQCRLLPKTRKRQSLLATPIVFVPVRFSGHAQSCKSAKMLSKYIDVVYRPGLNPSKSHSSMAK